MTRAVHFAHQRGILHRDRKPSNILLNEGFDDGGKTIVGSVCPDAVPRIELEWRSLRDLASVRRLTLDGEVKGSGISARARHAEAGRFALGEIDGRVRVWSTRTSRALADFMLPDLLSGKPEHRIDGRPSRAFGSGTRSTVVDSRGWPAIKATRWRSRSRPTAERWPRRGPMAR